MTEINYYEEISSEEIITIENVSNDIEIKKKKEPVAKLVNGDLDTVDSEICIKDECFHVISSTSDRYCDNVFKIQLVCRW